MNHGDDNKMRISGLRPLDGSMIESFWDAINFKIDPSVLIGPEREMIYPSVEEETMMLDKSEEYVLMDISEKSDRLTRQGISYARVDESYYIRYYAPLEPLILLPNHFRMKYESLEILSKKIEGYLESRDDIAFTSSGSVWCGSILRTSSHCGFRFCVYMSRDTSDIYIVEGQRIEGDGFLFGGLYQGVKSLFSDRNRSIRDDIELGETTTMDVDDNDLRRYAENVKDMILSEDNQIVLNGILFASEMCTDDTLLKYVYIYRFIEDLFKIIRERNVGYGYDKKWNHLHALIGLSHLSKKDRLNFKQYLSERLPSEDSTKSLLQIELESILEIKEENTSEHKHMIRYASMIIDNIV